MKREGAVKRVFILGLISIGFVQFALGQQVYPINITWFGSVEETLADGVTVQLLGGAGLSYDENLLPIYDQKVDVPFNHGEVELKNAVWEVITEEELYVIDRASVPGQVEVRLLSGVSGGKLIKHISFCPLIQDADGGVKKLLSGEFLITPSTQKTSKVTADRYFENQSVLASGEWYKVGVTEEGMYKVMHEDFVKAFGNGVSFSSASVGLFGSGGKMLPFDNGTARVDDLRETSIEVVDGGDGTIDAGDYIIFYAPGPHHWEYSSPTQEFTHLTHQYSDTAYYFLTIDQGGENRVASRASLDTYDSLLTTFTHYEVYENDLTSLTKSGRTWYGETFNSVTNYTIPFSVGNIDTTVAIRLEIDVAARVIGKENDEIFSFTNNGELIGQITVPGVSGDYAGKYAEDEAATLTYKTQSASQSLGISFDRVHSSSIGWLDFIELHARRRLKMEGGLIMFRNPVIYGVTNLRYALSGVSESTRIWDVTDSYAVKNQTYELNNGTAAFNYSQDGVVHQFVGFNTAVLQRPKLIRKVANQNLHGLEVADYVIVAHKDYLAQAQELGQFHWDHDSLTYIVVTSEQVYNEFSSGASDLTAIKDFMKMFYDRAAGDPDQMVKYLLLFGDGSYDNKYRKSGNTNRILTYQSVNSLHAIGSYVSDDYFGLLDDDESERTSDLVDLGVGRLPVNTVEQAKAAVTKIKRYYNSETMGAWRNMVAFIGDDEDSRIHMIQSDILAEYIDTAAVNANLDKIYFDAFQQITSAGGDRYPGVNEAIDSRVSKGALLISYVGHGGELGWGHERVLELSQINGYNNLNNMPLFMTATCEFARYDDPERTSAGEFVFLNPQGGGIGLLTTTRLVLSSPNFALAQEFNKLFFEPMPDGTTPRLGDLVYRTKLESPLTINTRNFTLLGDPAVRLAYPKYEVRTTFSPDTMKALGRVTVTGEVVDQDGNVMTDFNGIIRPKVYDKEATVNTLNNDKVGKFGFGLQKSIIYNGKASVTNGEFSFSFVVPRDISQVDGFGKISYYADNGEVDAAGSYELFRIQGKDTTNGEDKVGPDISLFMNNEQFIYGGITDENPNLVVKLFDENGINTVGTGIGHDIMMTLDGHTAESVVLNDYYESELDSYQEGTVTYKMSDLEEGQHTLKVKAWDVHNNSSEAEISFVVVKESDLTLDHILNYPNPFTTNTGFYFEHNHPYQNLDVRLQVFTVAGRVVKTIDTRLNTTGFRAGPIPWDGLDDFGDPLARGTYLYKIKVTSSAGQTVEEFSKLVVF